jgi:molecular chaperone DnaK
MEKMLKENEAKVSASDRAPINAAIEHVKETAKGEDAAAIKQAIAELHQASHAMAQHLYGQRQTAGAGGSDGGAGAGTAGKDEDVQDAEFEVKK